MNKIQFQLTCAQYLLIVRRWSRLLVAIGPVAAGMGGSASVAFAQAATEEAVLNEQSGKAACQTGATIGTGVSSALSRMGDFLEMLPTDPGAVNTSAWNAADVARKVLGTDQIKGGRGQAFLAAVVKMADGDLEAVIMPFTPKRGVSGWNSGGWRDFQKEVAEKYGFRPLNGLKGSGLHAEENLNAWLYKQRASMTSNWSVAHGVGGTDSICTAQACRRIVRCWPLPIR